VNDRPAHLAGIAAIANGLAHALSIDLEPYHALGSDKRARLGLPPGEAFLPPDTADMREYQDRLGKMVSIPVSIS